MGSNSVDSIRQNKSAQGTTDERITVLRTPRDGQDFVKMVNEFEQRLRENAVGNHTDVARGR